MNNVQNNMKMKLLLNEADDASCKECSGIYFEPIFRVKRISAIMSPSGKEAIVPVQVLRCQECHAILNDLTDFAETSEENTKKTTKKETKKAKTA